MSFHTHRAFQDSARGYLSGESALVGGPGDREDPYEILDLRRDCSASAVRQRYLKLIAKCHPDKAEGSRERFDAVKRAYDLLSSKEKRQAFDKESFQGK